MEPARERRILQIVDEAMELEASERAAFVECTCRDDLRLRNEVESFLKYDSGVSIDPVGNLDVPSDLSVLPVAGDRYELRDEIARGGMGVVYRAYDHLLDREVAVKAVLCEHANNEDLVRRFLEEARVNALLQHPGIAAVYDLGQLPDGRPFFAMKLVRGQTLAAMLSERHHPELEQSKLLGIFEQLCQTVAYAHSHQIIHRDLKPANVMVGQFGEVQVMDWGLAKVLANSDTFDEAEINEFRDAFESSAETPPVHSAARSVAAETRIGVAMGTPAYMPPEQAVGIRDKTTDVFALGAILCEILTGDPPYLGATPTQVNSQSAHGHTTDAIARLDQCGRDQQLIRIAKKCLATFPEDRWQTAAEVVEPIAHYRETTQRRLQDAEVAAARAETEAREERKRFRLTVAAAMLVGIMFLLIVGGWSWFTQDRIRRGRAAADQQTRRALEIQTALTEARGLYDRAQSAPIEELDPWIEARAAVARAMTLVRTENVDSSQAEDVHALRDAIAKGEADRKLVLAIEAARDSVFANPDSSDQRDTAMRESLEDAFRQHDLHPDSKNVVDAVAGIASFSDKVRVEVIGALDQWLLHAGQSQRSWLLDVLSQSDSDQWRKRWRNAYVEDDATVLQQMFRDRAVRHRSGRDILNLHQSARNHLSTTEQIAILKIIQPLHPDDFWLNIRLAELVWEEKQTFDALSYYSAAAAIRSNGPLHTRIGDIMLALHRYSEAGEHYGKAELLYFNTFNTEGQWARLGVRLKDAGRYEEAITALKKAAELQPQSSVVLNELGNTLRLAGRNDEALHVLRRAAKVDPENFWSQFHIGSTLVKVGDYPETVRVFEPLLSRADSEGYRGHLRNASEYVLPASIRALQRQLAASEKAGDETCLYFSEQARRWIDLYLQNRGSTQRQRMLDDHRFEPVRDPGQLAKLSTQSRRSWEEFWASLRSEVERAKEDAKLMIDALETSTWHSLRPDEMRSVAGAEMTCNPDASVLVTGIHEANDDYIIDATVHTMRVAAVRLDVLSDASLPNRGPGRHETGNFQLAEVLIDALDDQHNPRRMTIADAWASYSWPERPIERSIDGNVATAWHVWGGLSKSHWAAFTLDEPVEVTKPWRIRITLRHGGDLGPGLGRFRLSVTPDVRSISTRPK